VIPRRDTPATLALIRKYVPVAKGDEKAMMEKVNAPLNAEGGVNVKLGVRNVSFVVADVYSGMLGGPMDNDEASRAADYAGEKLGELILHELGHGMGAKHGPGLMTAKADLSVNFDAPSAVQHFSPASRVEILKTLEQLAKD
jgi:hypothetical protein